MFLFKRKNGTYYLQFKDEISGKQKAISTKAKYKPEALKFLSQFNSKLKAARERKQIVFYISDLRNEVLKYVLDNMQGSTCQIYNRVLNDMLRIIGNKPVKLITVKDIENYKSFRISEVKPSTVNIDLSTMKAAFNIALRFDWISINPVKSVKKILITQKEYLSFTETQVNIILNNIHNTTIRDFVRFAFLTGCRLNELINLQWKDVNFADRLLTIRNKENFKTKTGKIRYIPISDSLFNLLNDILQQNPGENVLSYFNPEQYIFRNINNFKYNKNYVSKYFKDVLRKLNFDNKFHFHCIRHTFISSLIKSGVNINYVREIAGHSEIRTTMNYIHISTEDLREAMNKINFS
jgi:site-specific recombinase XerD